MSSVRRSAKFTGRAVAVLSVIVLACVAQAQERRQSDVRPAIWQKFRERQAEAETAEATWMQRFIRAGSAADPARGPLAPDEEPPPEIVIPDHETRFVAAGSRVRYERAGVSFARVPRVEPGKVVRSISTFNDQYYQSFYDASDRKGPTGNVIAFDEFRGWGNVHLGGPVLAMRPLHAAAFGPSFEPWRVEPSTRLIDGHECVVLSESSRTPGSTFRAYLDPKRDYVPLRFAMEQHGQTALQADMRYDRTEPPVWVPSSWKSIIYYFGDTRSFEQSENRLLDVTLSGEFPDETFEIDYPEGTELSTSAPGLAKQLVVDKAGNWIPLRRTEAEATSAGPAWWLWLAAIGAAALGGAGLLLWRRRAADGT